MSRSGGERGVVELFGHYARCGVMRCRSRTCGPEISLRAEAGCSSHPGSTSTLTRCPAGDYRVAHLRAPPASPRRPGMRASICRAAAALGVLVVSAALGIGAAGSAAAHPTLLFTDPAADTAVPVAPQAITLMFNEPVTIGSDAVVVLDKDGRAMPIGAATTARGGQLVTARPAAPLAARQLHGALAGDRHRR